MTTLADRKKLKNQKNIINAYHNQFLKSSFFFYLREKLNSFSHRLNLSKKNFQSVSPCCLPLTVFKI